MSTRQRTFSVNGEKITIKSRPRSHMRNPNGFHVWINGERFYCNLLERDKAEDHCYARWVKNNVRVADITERADGKFRVGCDPRAQGMPSIESCIEWLRDIKENPPRLCPNAFYTHYIINGDPSLINQL